MPGRFYYHPVEPGYERAAEGLARGIFGATDQYEQKKLREREQPMRDLLEARAMADAERMGIHRGLAPEQPGIQMEMPTGPDFSQQDPGFGLQSSAQHGGLGFTGEPRGGGLGLTMDPSAWMKQSEQQMAGPQADYSNWSADPRFRQLTDSFYQDTPEWQREQSRREAEAVLHDDPRLDILRGMGEETGISPESVVAFPGLLESYMEQQGVAPAAEGDWRQVVGAPGYVYDPRTGDTRALDVEFQTATPNGLMGGAGGAGGSGGVTATALYTNRARIAHNLIAEVRRIHSWEPKPGETPEAFQAAQREALAGVERDYRMSLGDALDFIRTGQWPGGDIGPTAPTSEGMTSMLGSLDRVFGNRAERGAPSESGRERGGPRGAPSLSRFDSNGPLDRVADPDFSATGEEPSDTGPGMGRSTARTPPTSRAPSRSTRGSGRLDKAEIDSARSVVRTLPPEQREAVLRQNGYDDGQIKQILEGDSMALDHQTVLDRYWR